MGFQESQQSLETASKELKSICAQAYRQARKLVGGNWQEPLVIKRRQEMAIKLADELMQNKKLVFSWETT